LIACGGSEQSGTQTEIATDNSTGDNSNVETNGSTQNVLCDYFYSEYNDSDSVQTTSSADWTCTGTTRDIIANGIPDHDVGTFPSPANPNTIAE
jgi:hypothetical protein